MKFSLFSTIDLQHHKTMTVEGGWKVNYLAFAEEKFAGIPPLVILGGAFQKFHSFKKEVENLSKFLPVVLVDLPGQGGNNQLAESLSFEDYAHILKSFVDEMGMERITPVALSYGSAIGYTYAALYPESTHRLILGGTTPKLRKSTRILLEESLKAMEQGRMKDFSTGVILNLFNYSQRKRTKIPRMLIRGFHKSLMTLSEEDKGRYYANTSRLLKLNGLGKLKPQCETLVLAGEFDNFTTPSECLAVANMCEKSIVGILRNCDHLAPFVRKELMINTYKSFALEGKIYEGEGISLYEHAEIPLEKKILEPRWSYPGEAKLKCPVSDWEQVVSIVDFNSYGLRIDLKDKYISSDKLRNLNVEFMGKDLELEAIFFDSTRDGLRGIFKRYDFDTYEKLEKFLSNLDASTKVFTPQSL